MFNMHHFVNASHYCALIDTCDTHLQVQAPALAVVWGSQLGKEKVTGMAGAYVQSGL